MKLYQGILALISYALLRFIVFNWISREYYDTISGIIALLVFGWLLHKKQLLHLSSRASPLPSFSRCGSEPIRC